MGCEIAKISQSLLEAIKSFPWKTLQGFIISRLFIFAKKSFSK